MLHSNPFVLDGSDTRLTNEPAFGKFDRTTRPIRDLLPGEVCRFVFFRKNKVNVVLQSWVVSESGLLSESPLTLRRQLNKLVVFAVKLLLELVSIGELHAGTPQLT